MVNEFDINSYTIQISDTISQAFKKINSNRGKNIFVVNNEVFCGAVSDGDLRRAILNGATLQDKVEVATNFNAVRANLEDSYADVNSTFMDEFDYLPILDRSKKIIRIIKKGEKIKIPLSEPNLSNRETELILDTLFTNMISSRGTYVEKFEKIFAEYLGINRNRVVAVSNGTLALYLALVTLGIKEGDEVIVPDLTFGATANAVIQAGAVPILVDINIQSWNIDIQLIEKAITPKTKAIIPVHLYGNPVDLESLNKLAKKFGLIVIEDAAEALGSYFQNSHVGITTEASTFSFFGNKTITTGEGGMVVFKDQESAEVARKIKDHGMSRDVRYFHDSWGSNFRLTNMQAAIGCAQMERIKTFVDNKQYINFTYRSTLEPLGCIFPKSPELGISSHWLTAFLLPDRFLVSECLHFLAENGIEARSFFYPLHAQPAFSIYTAKLSNSAVSQYIFERGLCLPSGTSLSNSDLHYVCSKMSEFLKIGRV